MGNVHREYLEKNIYGGCVGKWPDHKAGLEVYVQGAFIAIQAGHSLRPPKDGGGEIS